jgi:hypothetical protein
MTTTQFGCEWFQSIAAEFALGSLTGAERSAAIAHLDGCDECQSLVKSLSTAADALLLVAPEIDPPAGFEVRLLERRRASAPDVMQAQSRPDVMQAGGELPGEAIVIPLHRRAPAILRAAAVAVVFAVGGFALAANIDSHNSNQTGSSIRVASLDGVGGPYAHARLGEVAITNGSPGLVVMTFDKSDWTGWVDCVVTEHGQSKTVGSFYVKDGRGSWSVQLSSPGSQVSAAQVDTPGGSVLATANFT